MLGDASNGFQQGCFPTSSHLFPRFVGLTSPSSISSRTRSDAGIGKPPSAKTQYSCFLARDFRQRLARRTGPMLLVVEHKVWIPHFLIPPPQGAWTNSRQFRPPEGVAESSVHNAIHLEAVAVILLPGRGRLAHVVRTRYTCCRDAAISTSPRAHYAQQIGLISFQPFPLS